MKLETAVGSGEGAPGPGAGDPRFRRLAIITTAVTALLIVIGGIVRVSESGLGCGPAGSGVQGWPFCNGRVVPGLDTNTLIEYSHRLTAGIVLILIVVLCMLARRQTNSPRLWKISRVALGIVVFQAALGGLTVEQGLHTELVAIHLGTAMILLAILLAAIHASRQGQRPRVERPDRPRRAVFIATALVFCATVAGGYMAGTQNYGTEFYEKGDGAHMACGKEFPTCNGSFTVLGQTRLVRVHSIHRDFVYLAVIAVVLAAVSVLRRRPTKNERKLAIAALLTLVLQVTLGILNVMLGEQEELIAAHLVVGTLLWGLVASLTLSYIFERADTRQVKPG